VRLVDEALARMGSDPCVCSFDLITEEVLDEVTSEPAERDALRAAVRMHLGLHDQQP